MPLRFRIRPPATADGATGVERTLDVEAVTGGIVLGRRSGSEIQLPFATVSGQHARVVRGPAGLTIEDLGSANGTFVGAVRISAGSPFPIEQGDVLRLADVTVVFEGPPPQRAAGETALESTDTLARRLVSDFFGACRPAELARVVVERGPDAGQAVTLSDLGRSYRVGRSPQCDLVLTDTDVSREHAAFERRWDGVEVRDLGSKNGVEMDGERLPGPRRIRDGDLAVLGGTVLKLEDPEERYLRQMQDEEARPTLVRGALQADLGPSEAPAAAREPELTTDDQPDAGRTPGPRRGGILGPVLIGAVALMVLAAIVAFVVWFLIEPE